MSMNPGQRNPQTLMPLNTQNNRATDQSIFNSSYLQDHKISSVNLPDGTAGPLSMSAQPIHKQKEFSAVINAGKLPPNQRT